MGVSHGLDRDLNDGLLHPWRRPFPGVSVPEKLSPIPITVLGPIYSHVLELVLWVTIKQSKKISSPNEISLSYPSEIEQISSESGFSLEPSISSSQEDVLEANHASH